VPEYMINKQINQYRIIQKLGEGGMGVVYLAEDTKLDRRVAIKSLPSHIASNSAERERFKVEAKAAAALNHPNIAIIHNIEENADHLYIIMEYIDGRELKEVVRANENKALPFVQVIDYAIQIARGLQAAHNKEIVHRDIKSANIMLTHDGQIKIMDFGLAKISGTEQLTKEGTTIGTAAYMSPEQARHEEADPRSDIWSFGIILYELLSGKVPFHGDYEAAVLYDILHTEPEPLESLNKEIPAELSQVVKRCLERDKLKRYQSAPEIISDLESVRSDLQSGSSKSELLIETESKTTMSGKSVPARAGRMYGIFGLAGILVVILIAVYFYLDKPASPEAANDKKMMVVLPFKNLGVAEQDYFADGITGEITSRLSGLSGLAVIARSSAMQYKNTTKSLRQIGEELGVQYLLDGTIQWEDLGDGNKRVRVNPELIQIDNGTQIWSKPYIADFSDVFQLQADIATQVTAAMNITLLASEQKSLQLKLTSNSDAYDYYLRGLDYFEDTFELEQWFIARQMFEKAIELDPNFAAAYASLGQLHADYYWWHYDRSDERLNLARINVQKAEQLDPDLYIVHKAKGWYYYHGLLDYENALIEFDKSLRIKPDDADAYMGVASVLRRQGKMQEAVNYFVKAIETNPRSPQNYGQAGETLFLLRRFDDAKKYLEKGFSMAPDDPYNYTYWVWSTFNLHSNIGEAIKELEDHLHLAGSADLPEYIYTLVNLDLINRDFDKALKRFEDTYELNSQFQYVPGVLVRARIFGLKNESQKAEAYYRHAQKILEQKIIENAEDSRFYSSLGIVYAGLGQKEKAIQTGKRGVDLMPVTKEAWRGCFRLQYLAVIYTMVGEKERAIELLEQLLDHPSDLSVKIIELDPVWDPLRDHPRFQQLVGEDVR